MSITLPKTIILAIATLLLAVAVLVTDLISPYADGVDSAISAGSPVQVEMPAPARAPAPVQVRELACNTAITAATTFDVI